MSIGKINQNTVGLKKMEIAGISPDKNIFIERVNIIFKVLFLGFGLVYS